MKSLKLVKEKKLGKRKYHKVFYLDEAGRGPLAGPVVAAAVQIDLRRSDIGKLTLKDSKKLTPKKRKAVYKFLQNHPHVQFAVGRVSEKVIDKINILEATKKAMENAIKNLEIKIKKCREKKQKISCARHHFHKRQKKSLVDFLVIDGNFKINSKIPQRSIMRADERILGCKIASIIAKVFRDKIMEKYHKKFPQYGFSKHKGYGTKYHLKMLKKYGPCEIHRKTFRPVATLQGS